MFLLSAVAPLSLAFRPPTVAWHKSFNLKGRPEIQIGSNNVNVRVDASDRKDGQGFPNWRTSRWVWWVTTAAISQKCEWPI
jgi:hypothetical protein